MSLTHRERLEQAIAGQKPDRSPVSLWRHFPVDDQGPESLAGSIVRFQEKFDFDFVKITPASTFCIKDYGIRDEWEGNPEGTRQIKRYAIKSPDDWLKIKPLHPRKGSLQEQLRCIKLVREYLPENTPIIQTIFSPLSQAKNLVGKDKLLAHLRMYPDQLNASLMILTENTRLFIEECIKLKVDGIFFAVQYAQYGLLSHDEFRSFGLRYDLEVLHAIKPLWFNVGHIHGVDIMFQDLLQYPVQVLNWHDLETSPTLKEGKNLYKGVVCGGLRQWETLAYGTPRQVELEALKAIQNTDGIRFILGTGCVTPVISPDANLFAARKAVESKQ